MRTIGIILILLGVAGFLVEAVSWTTSEEILDAGPVEVEKQERKTIPVTPLAAGIAVAGGVVLVVLDSRRKSS